ncbi:MAG: hypothetical protein ACLP81_08320, partial [Acidimicrobiales bacterium]
APSNHRQGVIGVIQASYGRRRSIVPPGRSGLGSPRRTPPTPDPVPPVTAPGGNRVLGVAP